MKHFLIYTNKHKDQELATTKRIQNYLETKGCTVKLKVKESDWKEEADSVAEEEATDIPLDVDCMIVCSLYSAATARCCRQPERRRRSLSPSSE